MAIALDDFNRANNADLGASWTPPTGAVAFSITSNEAAVTNGATECAEYNTTITPGPAQYSKVVLGSQIETNTGASGVGPAVRMATGARTYYQVLCNAGGVSLWEMSAGSRTQRGSTFSHTCIAGDIVELDISEIHVLTVILNGTTVITFNDSASPISTGVVGIAGEIFNVLSSITSWEGGDLVPPAVYQPQMAAQTRMR